MPRRALLVTLCVLCAVLAGCQPRQTAPPAPSAVPASAADRRGAPESGGVPAAVGAIVDATRETALRWQDAPVPAEVAVTVEQGVATAAEVTWLAGEADRLQLVRLDAEGVREERPTLATVGALPVSEDGLEQVPPPPEELLGPVALVDAAAAALRACGARVGAGPVQVDYATGAPLDWDGTAFGEPPSWSATVGLVGDGGGVAGARVDPTTGAGTDDCFEVAPTSP